ncbi:hypothetical protein ACPA9J_30605 [Pseudomonas aeruginosa]
MRDKRFRQHSLVAVFEGNDAAGKGGAIRRVTDALDPRQYHIVPIAAPTEEERAQPISGASGGTFRRVASSPIFDRSWYGRVLVERIEELLRSGRLAARLWRDQRLPRRRLSEYGIIVVKFWLAIDKQTQMERFKGARENPYKRYKITEEDWRNRDKWDQYVDAVGDMVDRYQHRDRALDPGRSQRQALRPGQGAAHHQRRHRGGVQEGQVRPAECGAVLPGDGDALRRMNDRCLARLPRLILASIRPLPRGRPTTTARVPPCVKW